MFLRKTPREKGRTLRFLAEGWLGFVARTSASQADVLCPRVAGSNQAFATKNSWSKAQLTHRGGTATFASPDESMNPSLTQQVRVA